MFCTASTACGSLYGPLCGSPPLAASNICQNLPRCLCRCSIRHSEGGSQSLSSCRSTGFDDHHRGPTAQLVEPAEEGFLLLPRRAQFACRSWTCHGETLRRIVATGFGTRTSRSPRASWRLSRAFAEYGCTLRESHRNLWEIWVPQPFPIPALAFFLGSVRKKPWMYGAVWYKWIRSWRRGRIIFRRDAGFFHSEFTHRHWSWVDEVSTLRSKHGVLYKLQILGI